MKRSVLIIEDEINIIELLRINLENYGFDVMTAMTGEEGLEKTLKEFPDIILLDIMLPGMDGFEICKRIRREKTTSKIPIIMLTAKSEEMDKVLALEIGADDYITKPFGIRELVARIKAVLRRIDEKEDTDERLNIIRVGDIFIDIDKHIVKKNGIKLELTLKEFNLLKVLAENREKVLSRKYLLDEISEGSSDPRSIDVHITNLRKKLGASSGYIETIRGIGYKMK
ncbi:response regulator transcription factor [Crassaminicella indica]|uniref:Response regulator transcription factor n=1 Tax=Crassaminicella indica TaxID=2855394 RepID=A0ABX8RDA9_9CLOT|nr:response regulator transcription factor [Crassaminicella indica]QXM07063.1 response regulator transcription factor [Crassaminicella indica]